MGPGPFPYRRLRLTPTPHRDQHPSHTSPSASPHPLTAPWQPHIPLFSPNLPYSPLFSLYFPLFPLKSPGTRGGGTPPALPVQPPALRSAAQAPSPRPAPLRLLAARPRPGPAMATDSWALAVDEQEAAAESVRGGRDRGRGMGMGTGTGPGTGPGSAGGRPPPPRRQRCRDPILPFFPPFFGSFGRGVGSSGFGGDIYKYIFSSFLYFPFILSPQGASRRCLSSGSCCLSGPTNAFFAPISVPCLHAVPAAEQALCWGRSAPSSSPIPILIPCPHPCPLSPSSAPWIWGFNTPVLTRVLTPLFFLAHSSAACT